VGWAISSSMIAEDPRSYLARILAIMENASRERVFGARR
jgi:hypothetical protein